MLITKIIETSVDLFNPVEIYAADIDAVLVEKLTTRYVSHCYKSVLITKINKILKRSDINLISNRIDGAAQVDVQIEVEGHILISGEVLHGCRIIEVRPGMIVAEHPIAKIHVRPGLPELDALIKMGAHFPISVREARYMVNSKAITVIGHIFHYQPPNTMLDAAGLPAVKNMPEHFSIQGDLANLDERARVERQITKIRDFISSNEAMITKGMQYVQCTTQPPDTKKADASIENIDSLDDLSERRVFTNAELDGRIFVENDNSVNNVSSEAGNRPSVYTCSLYIFCMAIANRHLLRLMAAAGFVEHLSMYPKTYISLLLDTKIDAKK